MRIVVGARGHLFSRSAGIFRADFSNSTYWWLLGKSFYGQQHGTHASSGKEDLRSCPLMEYENDLPDPPRPSIRFSPKLGIRGTWKRIGSKGNPVSCSVFCVVEGGALASLRFSSVRGNKAANQLEAFGFGIADPPCGLGVYSCVFATSPRGPGGRMVRWPKGATRKPCARQGGTKQAGAPFASSGSGSGRFCTPVQKAAFCGRRMRVNRRGELSPERMGAKGPSKRKSHRL